MGEAGPRIYDAAASVYDAVSALIPFEAALREEAVAALGSVEGGTVLDLGCGTGLAMPGLALAVGAKGSVVGVDTSARSLQVAARRAGKVGVNFVGHAADAATAPWGAQRFAGGLSIFALSVIGEWEQTLTHVRDALLPGACLVILEQRYATSGFARAFNPVARVFNLALAADPNRDFAGAMRALGLEARTTLQLGGFYALHVGRRT